MCFHSNNEVYKKKIAYYWRNSLRKNIYGFLLRHFEKKKNPPMGCGVSNDVVVDAHRASNIEEKRVIDSPPLATESPGIRLQRKTSI